MTFKTGLDGIPPEAPKVDRHVASTLKQDLGAGESAGRLEKRTAREAVQERRPVILWQLAGNYVTIHPGQSFDKDNVRETEDHPVKRLRDEQAGFRHDRSCTDHIATMRIIIEQ